MGLLSTKPLRGVAGVAGPAIVVSFIVAGVACAFAGLAYAEVASMIPVAGSRHLHPRAERRRHRRRHHRVDGGKGSGPGPDGKS